MQPSGKPDESGSSLSQSRDAIFVRLKKALSDEMTTQMFGPAWMVARKPASGNFSRRLTGEFTLRFAIQNSNLNKRAQPDDGRLKPSSKSRLAPA